MHSSVVNAIQKREMYNTTFSFYICLHEASICLKVQTVYLIKLFHLEALCRLNIYKYCSEKLKPKSAHFISVSAAVKKDDSQIS